MQPQTKEHKETPQNGQSSKARSFFIPQPSQPISTNLISVHNLSSVNLSQTELQLLSKGLSFAPTPIIPDRKAQLKLLSDYDQFAQNLRTTYERSQMKRCTLPGEKITIESSTTSFIHRPMKFLPKTSTTPIQYFSGIPRLDHYIDLTKNNLNDNLSELLTKTESNLTKKARASIKSLKNNQQSLTIKPADKNLGIVLMNTDDYLLQCSTLLTNKTT